MTVVNPSDVLVIGAGLAGLPTALACAQAGWRVTLVDENNAPPKLPDNPLDQRCTAIGSASEQLLKRWGLWEFIQPNAQAIRQVHVAQQGYLGRLRLRAEECGVNALGHVIENRQWVATLTERAKQDPNITFMRAETVVSISESNADSLTVALKSGKSLNTRLLIGTDGVNSCVRAQTGVAQNHVDYDQSGLMCSVRVSKPHNGVAFERFTPEGPLAFLPRPGYVMSVVWCMSPAAAERMNQASDTEILQRLEVEFGQRLGALTELGPRAVVPLIRQEATEQTGRRTVLLGNANRLLHPVAGQGFNLALRDLAGLLDEMGWRTGDKAADPGGNELLKRFTEQRAGDQREVVWLTDALARTFRGRSSLPTHVRSLGLLALDKTTPLRRVFAQRTMGYTG